MTMITSPFDTSSENIDCFYPLELDESWRSRSGKGVSVAIIDSGIDTEHPDLLGKVAESVEAQNDNKRVLFIPSETGDSAGHGTACAGIISSIAKDSVLFSI